MPAKAKPKTIDEYINARPEEAREKLRTMLDTLRKAAPGAKESLKWGTPALSYDRILFIFAAFKHHISLYPTPAVVKSFAKELSKYKTSAATIQFSLDKPLPLPLIRKVAA